MTELILTTPPNFNFKRTAISHGWYDLPPFELDQAAWRLVRVIDLGNGRPTTAAMSTVDGGVKIETSIRLNKPAWERVFAAARHMLRLDEDLSGFYTRVAEDNGFRWISKSGAGRLLRSPTVFEDLVKTICTTNCSWSLTGKMVNALVDELGVETGDGKRAFPTAEAMANKPLRFYRDKVRAGYRASYLKELATRVASGMLDPQAWLTSELPTSDLKLEIKQVKGVGDYAAENLLRLLGRYDTLALDSWVRAKFSRTRNGGRKASDKKIERYYSRFGKWKGLALWCDMTCDWLDDEAVSKEW